MWIHHLSHRRRKIIWLMTLIAMPIVIVGLNVLVRNYFVSKESTTLYHYVDVVTTVLSYGVGAWFINQGLKIFLWEDIYIRLTGMSAPAVIRGAVSVVIYIVTTLVILVVVLELNLNAVLLSTGLVAAVLGVAMQNTITDFFSGITLGIDKPYNIGDWIEFEDGTIGQVVDITWRSTRIRSWNASLYVVPNKKAAHITVHNYSWPTKSYGYWFNVSVNSEISPLVVRQLLLEAALKCKQVADEPVPNIYLSDISTQPFSYMVFVHFSDYPMRFRALDELHLEIYRQFRKAGIAPAAIKYEIDTRHAKVPTVSAPTVAQILRNVPAFSPIGDRELNELSTNLWMQDKLIGQVIVEEGQAGGSLFVVVSGIVVLSRTIGGKPRELERVSSGQCFGEMSLLTGEPRYTTAKAVTNVRFIEIPKASFASIMVNNEKLQEEMAKILATRRAQTEALQQTLYYEPSSDALTIRVPGLKRLIRDFFKH